MAERIAKVYPSFIDFPLQASNQPPPVSEAGSIRMYADKSGGDLMVSIDGAAYVPIPTGLTPGGPPSGPASGDLTGSYPNPTLKAIVSALTAGSASKTVTLTIDTKGRVTALADQDIAIAQAQVSGLVAVLATFLVASNNLSDLTDASAARSALGLGSAATQAAGSFDASGAAAAAQTAAEAYADATFFPLASVPITNGNLANMIAHTFKGRKTNSTGSPEDLTVSDLAGLLAGTTAGTLAAGNDSRFSQLTYRTITGTTDAPSASDAGLCLRTTNGSAVTITFDTSLFSVGDAGIIRQVGAGQVTVAVSGGQSIISAGGKVKTNVQYSEIAWSVDATNTLHLAGDLA